MEYLVGLILCLVLGFVGYLLGKPKEQEGMGFLLGFLLGPIGLIIVALLPSKARPPAQGGVHFQQEDPMAKWEREQRLKEGPPPPPPGWKREE